MICIGSAGDQQPSLSSQPSPKPGVGPWAPSPTCAGAAAVLATAWHSLMLDLTLFPLSPLALHARTLPGTATRSNLGRGAATPV